MWLEPDVGTFVHLKSQRNLWRDFVNFTTSLSRALKFVFSPTSKTHRSAPQSFHQSKSSTLNPTLNPSTSPFTRIATNPTVTNTFYILYNLLILAASIHNHFRSHLFSSKFQSERET